MKSWLYWLALMLMSYHGASVAHPEEGDPTQNVRLLRPLAEKGNPLAQYNLAVLYANGSGVRRDYQEAAKWYRLSAAQGTKLAQYQLGVFYADGKGVKQHFVRAYMWYTLAAAKGHVEAKKRRDGLIKRMKPAMIAEAEKLADDCEKRNYSGCE